MKRLFLFVAVAALGITGTAQAQEAKFDEAAIIKKVEKLELDSQTPKRGARASSWIDLGMLTWKPGRLRLPDCIGDWIN